MMRLVEDMDTLKSTQTVVGRADALQLNYTVLFTKLSEAIHIV